MSGVELTERGRNSALALVVALSFALVFLDPIILFACILIGAALAYDYWKVRSTFRRAEKLVEIEPEEVEANLTAGDMDVEELEITNSSGLSIGLSAPMDDAFLTPSIPDGDTASIDLIFTPDLAGKYRLDGIEAEFEGSLGLTKGSSEIPFEFSLDVRPRVLAAAVRAARFLAGTERIGVGDEPLQLKGAGLEYAGSREYQPGDEPRHIDWKATARLNRPIVKEFYIEGGPGIHLLYDARAPDPVSRDELSASFLNAALAAAREAVPIGLTVQDGGRLIANRTGADPKTAVALALRYTLEISDVDVEEFYTVLEPSTSRGVRNLMERLRGGSLKEPVSGRREAQPEDLGEAERAMWRVVESSEGNLQIGAVSSLPGNISRLLDLENLARQKGCRLSILQPTEPWRHAEGLEESYRIRKKYSRAYRVLQRRGVPVDFDLEDFTKTLASRRAELVTRG